MPIESFDYIQSVLIESVPNLHIQDCRVKNLTIAGDNFGSILKAIQITEENGKKLDLVGKMVPQNQFVQKMFETVTSFRNEIEFYKTIIPTLSKFQIDNNLGHILDFTPKYYGSNANFPMGPNEKNTRTEPILLLENLKFTNYKNLDRHQGFDLATAQLILTNLAQFHAVPLALKLKNPNLFEAKIRPYLGGTDLNGLHQIMGDSILQLVGTIKEICPLVDRVRHSFKLYEKSSKSIREPYATVVHNDFWINNIMIQIDPTTQLAQNCKIIDYQFCQYGSPAKDLIFFLFSSLEEDVVQMHFDRLVRFYYDQFSNVLQQYNCDLMPFTFDSFLNEIRIEAESTQLFHICFMLHAIFAPKGRGKVVEDLKEKDFVFDPETVTDRFKRRLIFVIQEFVKRNWLLL